MISFHSSDIRFNKGWRAEEHRSLY